MIGKFNQRDIRTLIIGAVCAAAILASWIVFELYDRRAEARASLAELNNKLELIDVDKAKRSGLMSIVPKFEMPQKEEAQRFLFRDKLDEQLTKAGIKSTLQVVSTTKSKQVGYKLLRMKCSSKCRLTQVLDLLANLKDNPYLVSVEELRIRCDKKNSQQVDMDLTVSTFIK